MMTIQLFTRSSAFIGFALVAACGGDSSTTDAAAPDAAAFDAAVVDVVLDAPSVDAFESGQLDAPPPACGPSVSGTQALYVATSGNDTNPGTLAQPFATITHAATVAKPGTVVHVAPGTYSSCVVASVAGTQTARIAFVSDVKWGAKIDVTSVSACNNAIFNVNANYIDVVDFDMTATPTIFLGIAARQSHGRIIGNRVHDFGTASCNGNNGGAGIDNTNYSASDNDIIDNWVSGIGNGCTTVQGIYTSQLGGHIYDNVAFDNSGYGIHCWHGCTGVTVANNLVFNNHAGGMMFGDGDSGATTFDNSIIVNNISVNNGVWGIYEWEYSGEHKIGSNNVFANNLVFGNAAGGFHLIEGNTESGTLTVDPQFVAYDPNGAGDYHLAKTSPAIGAGVSNGAPAYDLDGVCRPQGKAFDIGPYEQ